MGWKLSRVESRHADSLGVQTAFFGGTMSKRAPRHFRVQTTAVAIGILGACVATQATAQSLAIEEVVVTARKKVETLIDVPLSVNVFTADQIKSAGIYDINDVTAMSAGLTYQTNMGLTSSLGRSGAGVAFRGAVNGQGTRALDNTGSIFVDGVFVSSGMGSINTTDIERIEVLKGPQSTYFGRNTFSGAVNFITKTPSMDGFKGLFEASGTTRQSYDVNASAEGPISEGKLAARVVASLHKKGAQYTTTDGGTMGDESSKSIVGTLYATPNDNLWVKARVHYQHDDDGQSNTAFLRGNQFGNLCPGRTFQGSDAAGNRVSFSLTRNYFCGAIPTYDQLGGERILSNNTSLFPGVLTRINMPNFFRDIVVNNALNQPIWAQAPRIDHMGNVRNTLRLSGQSEYKFSDGTTLALNLGYEKNSAIVVHDGDHTDAENGFAVNPIIAEGTFYELRLTSPQDQRLRWLAGASYFWNYQKSQQFGYNINSVLGAPLPTTGNISAVFKDRGSVPAGFAAVEFDVLRNLTASAEVRYQSDTSIAYGTPTTISKAKSWLPRFILKYKPDEKTNLYASWAKGVMPASANSGFITATASQKAEVLAVYPDAGPVNPLPKVTSYELGAKQRLFNDRLQYSLALYYMKWDNINFGATVNVTTSPFAIVVTRSNSINLKGIEFESQALLTDKWSVNFVFDYKHNRLTRYNGGAILGQLAGGVTNFVGNAPSQNPEITGSLSSTYRDQLNADWDWFVRGDANYTGKQWDTVANIAYIKPSVRVNARLGIEKENLTVELFAKNLFDNKNWISGTRATSLAEPGTLIFVNAFFTTAQGLLLTAPDRREIGLKASMKF